MADTNLQMQINAGSQRMSARLLVICSLIAIAGFAAVCAGILLDVRRGEEGLARQSSENVAAAIDADISRNFEALDLSLRAVLSNLTAPEINGVSREIRHLILFDHAATAKHFAAIRVFDANGKLTIDASTFDPPDVSIADDEFFRAHAENENVGLYISRPTLYRSAYSIVLSRRINSSTGQFLGVVTGAIRISYFHDFFGRLRLGQDDIISVIRRDGVVIMRAPFDLDIVGKNLASLPVVSQALRSPSGSANGPGQFSGVKRLFVWRGADDMPVVLVGKTWESVYSVWRQQVVRIGSIIALLAVLAILATSFLAREIGRRTRAEASLEELATTDALTGLRNRRKFDQQLAEEWRRAQRGEMPLAMLMIDADHFKAYNDRFGHQAGDQALCAVAACIARASRRVGDCAARYGGEEFALLLPGLGVLEALQIAESIRRDIGCWDGGCASLSVSIGVASMKSEEDTSEAALLEAADRALYEAKTSGRNQSRIALRSPMALVA